MYRTMCLIYFSLEYNFSLQVTRAIIDQFTNVSKGNIKKEEVERAKYVVAYCLKPVFHLANLFARTEKEAT